MAADISAMSYWSSRCNPVTTLLNRGMAMSCPARVRMSCMNIISSDKVALYTFIDALILGELLTRGMLVSNQATFYSVTTSSIQTQLLYKYGVFHAGGVVGCFVHWLFFNWKKQSMRFKKANIDSTELWFAFFVSLAIFCLKCLTPPDKLFLPSQPSASFIEQILSPPSSFARFKILSAASIKSEPLNNLSSG